MESPTYNKRTVRSETIKSLGKQVRDKRTAKKWTSQKLADETGIQRTHLSRLENGELNPTIETLEKIAAAMNMRLEITFVRNKEMGED